MDQKFFEAVFGLAHQFKVLDWLAIFFADYLGYFLIFGFVWMLIRGKDWKKSFKYFAFAALSVILSRGILTEIIRFFYFRPRPFAVLDIEPLVDHTMASSFPSGHAAFYFALAFAIFSINRRWGSWYLLSAALIGAARVVVGVHWPLDILAGFLVAALSFFVVKWILVRTLKTEN